MFKYKLQTPTLCAVQVKRKKRKNLDDACVGAFRSRSMLESRWLLSQLFNRNTRHAMKKASISDGSRSKPLASESSFPKNQPLDLLFKDDGEDTPRQFVFKPQFSMKTGKTEWIALDATYDYRQEIARSKYGDMLHDDDRNVMYYEALAKVITARRALGESVHVLDIGTGTGILAMMAASLGADRVTACEAFEPVAEIAKKCIADNGFIDKIKLVGKRSTAMSVDDMHSGSRANVLVAEVFDTELIGEGALSTFRTALTNLLTDDAVTIPDSAQCFVQLISSKRLFEYCRFRPAVQFSSDAVQLNETLHIPETAVACAGLNTVWDVQFSDLLQNFSAKEVEILPHPIPCGEFEFSQPDAACFQNAYNRRIFSSIPAPAYPIQIHGVLFWWVLYMDKEHTLTIDTRPRLHTDNQPPADENPAQVKLKSWYWRDHWIQGIYMLPKPVDLKSDRSIALRAQHDEYSWNFNLISESSREKLETLENNKIEHPGCTCSWHMRLNGARIAELNDAATNSRWFDYINSLARHGKIQNLLFVGDFSFLPFVAHLCLQPDAAVWVLCQDDSQWKLYEQMLAANPEMRIQRAVTERLPLHFDCCISDVFFNACGTVGSLPWEHALTLRNILSNLAVKTAANDAIMLPGFAVIYAMPVKFDHLHKNRVPVGSIAGFSLREFDDLIDCAIEECDDAVEPYRLCEYPAKCVAPPKPLICIELTSSENSCAADFAKQYGCVLVAAGNSINSTVLDCLTQFCLPTLSEDVNEINGLTLWTDYLAVETCLGSGDAGKKAVLISSTGFALEGSGSTAASTVESGKYAKWNRFRSQGVYLLPTKIPLQHSKDTHADRNEALIHDKKILNVVVQFDLENAFLSVKNISLI